MEKGEFLPAIPELHHPSCQPLPGNTGKLFSPFPLLSRGHRGKLAPGWRHFCRSWDCDTLTASDGAWMAWGCFGGKRPSQQSLPSEPAGISAAAPGRAGESCPHPAAFAPSLALVPAGKRPLFHSQRFTTLHQDRDLTVQFSHICHVASAYGSISHPQSPCADSSTGHCPQGQHLLPPVPSASLERYSRLSRAERGAEAGTESAVSLLLGWVWRRSFQASVEQRGEGVWGGGRDRGLRAPKKGLIEAGTGICGSQRGRGPPARTAAGIVPLAPGKRGRAVLSPILVVCSAVPPRCPALRRLHLCCRWCCKPHASRVCGFQRVGFMVEGVLAGSWSRSNCRGWSLPGRCSCFTPTPSTDVSESHQVLQGQEQQLSSLLGQEKTPLFGHHQGEGEK